MLKYALTPLRYEQFRLKYSRTPNRYVQIMLRCVGAPAWCPLLLFRYLLRPGLKVQIIIHKMEIWFIKLEVMEAKTEILP